MPTSTIIVLVVAIVALVAAVFVTRSVTISGKEKEDKENEARFRAEAITKDMPRFVRSLFMSEENHLSGMTLYSYASQLHTFFEFLLKNNPYFSKTFWLSNIIFLDSFQI